MIWNTRLITRFGCKLPIMGAPMAGIAGGLLAAEVCRAGGLGFIGAGHCSNVNEINEQITIFREEEKKHIIKIQEKQQRQQEKSFLKQSPYPLSLGFIGHSTFKNDAGWDKFQSILQQHKPDVIQFFAPAVVSNTLNVSMTNISFAKECCNCLVLAQVGTVAEAINAVKAGADGLIIQGSEAGVHDVRREYGNGTLSLTLNILSIFPDIPVIAGGGIVDGRGIAAMLLAGCDGVVLGTRLWASHEAMGNNLSKQALIQSSSCDDVIRTTVFDTIQNTYTPNPWPEPYDSVGALKNDMTKMWEGKPKELANKLQSDNVLANEYKLAGEEGDVTKTAVLAGEGVGIIDQIEYAYDIVTKINLDAITILQTKPKELLRHDV